MGNNTPNFDSGNMLWIMFETKIDNIDRNCGDIYCTSVNGNGGKNSCLDSIINFGKNIYCMWV